jgi:hypothetical protein
MAPKKAAKRKPSSEAEAEAGAESEAMDGDLEGGDPEDDDLEDDDLGAGATAGVRHGVLSACSRSSSTTPDG